MGEEHEDQGHDTKSLKKLGESVWFEINVTNKDQEEERRAAKILLMLWAVFGAAQQVKREELGFQIEVRAINRAEAVKRTPEVNTECTKGKNQERENKN